MRKVTMTEIAKALGVSRSLVSYALTDKYGVSEEMKRHIITKAVEMGYFKTPHASLKISKRIAVIIGEEYLGEESFFTRIIAGIENSALEKKFIANILSLKDGEDVEQFVSRIIDSKPWGLIVIRQMDKKLAEYFKKLNMPKVFVDLIDANPDCFEVRVNNYGNSYKMTEYLIRSGCDKLVFVGDVDWALSYDERYRGFLAACREYGVAHTDIIGKDGKSRPFDDVAFADYVRKSSGSAVVCASDSIAHDVYEIIKAHNKSIPADFSVVGFDDMPFVKQLDPPLTTMHIPRFELGRVAFGLLREQIGYYDAQSRQVCLNAKLVERQSVKVNSKNQKESVEQ